MDRCYVSEQIAEHCNQPEPIECPECNGGMTQNDDGDYICDDSENCDGFVSCTQDEE